MPQKKKKLILRVGPEYLCNFCSSKNRDANLLGNQQSITLFTMQWINRIPPHNCTLGQTVQGKERQEKQKAHV